MNAIQLYDKEEECIGTVILKGNADFPDITFVFIRDAWDKYLSELDADYDEPDIYDFVSKGNWEMCEVLNLEYYQPR